MAFSCEAVLFREKMDTVKSVFFFFSFDDVGLLLLQLAVYL